MKKLLTVAIGTGLVLAAAAMPSKNELKKVQGVVNELMSGDMQALKSGKLDAAKVAANAEQYAREADTEAAKFLLLKGAFGLYVQGGRYDEALRVLDVLTREVKDVPDKVLSEIVVAKLKKLSKNEASSVFAYYERLEKRMRLTEERVKLEKALKENPASKDANRELAVCLVGLGDWKGALAHFALADGKEADAAKAETDGKTVTAADLWWEAAPEDGGTDYREHAAALYRTAMDAGKLTGLKLALAKKRIAEASPAEAPAAEEEKPVADKVADEEKPVCRKAAPVAVPKGKYDWTIPANLKGLRTMDFDVGCAEKMKFLAVPPGTYQGLFMLMDHVNGKMVHSQKPFTCKITHPFWVMPSLVTLEQYKSLGLECTAIDIDKLAEACKGDKSVAVYAPVTLDETEAFYRVLNERFGHLLPKGQVFRPLTHGEECLYYKRLRDNGVWAFNPNGEDWLKAYHAKKLFPEYETAKDLHASKYRAGHFPYCAFGYYAGKLRADCPAVSSPCVPLLDRISTPGIDKAPEEAGVMAEIVKLLNLGKVMTDPFWYCDEKAPNRRFAQTVVWRLEQYENYKPVSLLRVAVGYDYVGEWKKKNGK